MDTAVTTRRWTWRMIVAVLAAAGLVLAACAADDAAEVDAADPSSEAPTGAEAPSEPDDPAEAAEDSALAREWAAIAEEVRAVISEHGFASEQFSQARDDAAHAGVGLLPAGMPVPDIESGSSGGISTNPDPALGCIADAMLVLSLQHAADRPYEFDEATEWFESGVNDAGWSAQTENLVGPDNPMAGQAEGVGYTVQTDDATWYVSIMTHYGTDLAYCPVG